MKKTWNFYGYTINVVNSREVDILCPPNSRLSQRESFRVVHLNPGQGDAENYAVALPYGQNYSLAYKWQFHFPAKNFGVAKIRKIMTISLHSADKNLPTVIYWASRILAEIYEAEPKYAVIYMGRRKGETIEIGTFNNSITGFTETYDGQTNTVRSYEGRDTQNVVDFLTTCGWKVI